MNLNTTSLTFDLPLRHDQINEWRGALADFVGKENDLFHNHDLEQNGGSTHYKHRYPLIQYRVYGERAAVFGINEGAKALDELRRNGKLQQFKIGGRNRPLEVVSRQREGGWHLQFTPKDKLQRYRIYRYLPFSPENYQRYKALFSVQEKMDFLQNLLVNHIVTFANEVGWKIPKDQKLELTINDLDRVKKVKVHDTLLMAFDLVFSVNATLPEGLGLGRKTAFGFGWIIPLE